MKIWRSFARVFRHYSIEEKVFSLVVAVIVVVLSVQGVLDFVYSPEFSVGESGVYTEALINDQPTLISPIYTDLSDANRQISSLVFSGLTKYDPEVQAFVGDLATLTVSEDKQTYSFTLKEDLLWHDGEPVTTEDIFFTFKDVIQSTDFQNPVLRANFEGVDIRKIDESTVEFILDNPNSFFITNLNVGILPKHILEGIPVADLPYHNFNLQPVGTGPYMIEGEKEQFNGGRERIVLARFEDYYGEKPEIKKIRFNIYPSSVSLLEDKDSLNVISRVPLDILREFEESGRFEFKRYQLPQYTAVFLNLDKEVFEPQKVRIAMQKSIDKIELLKILPNKSLVDTPLMQLDQSEWLNEPNLEEAQGALFDSGYKMVEGSDDPYRVDEGGNVFSLSLLVRQHEPGSDAEKETKALVDFLVESWKEAGVLVDAQFESLDVFTERIKQRDYDMVLTGQSLGYNLDTYAYWHSTQQDESGLNLSQFENFAADSIIENIRDTFDNDQKGEQLQRLAELISSEIPAIFLYRPSYIYATDGKVQGVNLVNLAYPSDRFAQIGGWCILCEEQQAQ